MAPITTPIPPVNAILAIRPVAPILVKVAKTELAATFPIPAWIPAATEPAAIPDEVNPETAKPTPTVAAPPPAAAVPHKTFSTTSLVLFLVFLYSEFIRADVSASLFIEII